MVNRLDAVSLIGQPPILLGTALIKAEKQSEDDGSNVYCCSTWQDLSLLFMLVVGLMRN